MSKPKSKQTAKIETVTPERAKKWLTIDARNRPIMQSLVARYAREMKAGRWEVTHQGIAFDEADKLLDGQHRLLACVEADTPFETWVTRNVDPKLFAQVDRGRSRSLGHNLALLGEKHYNQLGAAITLQWQYDRDALWRRGELGWPEMAAALETLEAHPNIRWGLNMASRLKNLASGGMLTFLYYQFAIRDSATNAWFFARLYDGCELEPDAPVRLLRERLMKNRIATVSKLTQRTTMALIIKAWNATYAQQSIKTLFWRPAGKFPQPFPSIEPVVFEAEAVESWPIQ